MTKILYAALFMVLFMPLMAARAAGPVATPCAIVDEEYDRYRKKGDDFFREGKYTEARRQYQNCLEVPGFENDTYASERITTCATALTLRQQATAALGQNKAPEALDLFGQLLKLNPDDGITKGQLANYHERVGNQFFNQKQYAAAKTSYQQALAYSADRQESLRLQIRNCDLNMVPVYPKRVGLKVLTGVVAVGAGAVALLLRSDFQQKLTALNQISQETDPLGTNIINTTVNFQRWETARIAAEAAQKNNGLYKACVGVAVAATVAELYLLVHRPRPRSRAFNWHPSSTSWGLALTYKL